jgi:hypothetical protein
MSLGIVLFSVSLLLVSASIIVLASFLYRITEAQKKSERRLQALLDAFKVPEPLQQNRPIPTKPKPRVIMKSEWDEAELERPNDPEIRRM